MKRQSWFHLYPDHPTASRLSIIGGGVRLASIFLLVVAILYTLVLGYAVLRILLASGFDATIFFLMEDLGEMVFGAFFLWGAFAVCRFAISVLYAKAELLAHTAQLQQDAQAAHPAQTVHTVTEANDNSST